MHGIICSLKRNFILFAVEFNKCLDKDVFHLNVMSEVWITEAAVVLYQIPGFTCFAACNETYRVGCGHNSLQAMQTPAQLATAHCAHIMIKVNNCFWGFWRV